MLSSVGLLRTKCLDVMAIFPVGIILFLLTWRGCLCAVNGDLECPSGLNNGASSVWLFLSLRFVRLWVYTRVKLNLTSVTADSTQLVWDICPWLAPTLFFMASPSHPPQSRAVNPKLPAEHRAFQHIRVTKAVHPSGEAYKHCMPRWYTPQTNSVVDSDSESERNFIEMVDRTQYKFCQTLLVVDTIFW